MFFQTGDNSDNQQSSDGGSEAAEPVLADVEEMASSAWEHLTGHAVEWAISAAAVLAIYFVFRIIRAAIAGVLRNKNQPANSVRNIFANLISGTNSLLIIMAAAALAGPFIFPLSDEAIRYLQKAFVIVIIIQAAIWLQVIARAVLVRVAERHSADESTLANALSLLTLFANIVIFALAGAMVLANVGIDITALVAGLGVGGIALALAAQNVMKDLFASLSIVLDRPFVKHDFIRFNDNLGEVQKIGLKTTRLRSLSGEQLIIGNDQLLAQEIRNYRRMSERRIVFTVGVLYQTPHAKLEKIPGMIRQIVEAQEGMTRFDRSHLSAFADSSINFETVYFVQSRDYNDYMDVQQKIYLALHKTFEQEGIDFAYPTRTLWIEGGGIEGSSSPAGDTGSASASRVEPQSGLAGRMLRRKP